MELSLKEAAALTGKSERQLRYLVQQGTLQARKVDGRWVFRREDLPLSEGQARAAQTRQQQLRETVDEALGTSDQETSRRRMTVQDLRAFRHGLELHAELIKTFGGTGPSGPGGLPAPSCRTNTHLVG